MQTCNQRPEIINGMIFQFVLDDLLPLVPVVLFQIVHGCEFPPAYEFELLVTAMPSLRKRWPIKNLSTAIPVRLLCHKLTRLVDDDGGESGKVSNCNEL